MTPETNSQLNVQNGRDGTIVVFRHQTRDDRRTKRVPDDQGELGHLLSFLAELHERRFTPVGIEQLRNPDEHLPILFADSSVHASGR
jgi:hypothetical protein